MSAITSSHSYTLTGTLSKVSKSIDSKGRPYLKGTLTRTSADGKTTAITAMATGKNVDSFGGAFIDGVTTLTGRFENNVFFALRQASNLPAEGFHRNQPCGPRGSSRRVIWLLKKAA